MARVPEVELERIKRDVPVERLAAARGVSLKRHGKDLIGLCPFHDDKEPSLVISPAKNLWHCLGACGEGGSVIDWVMRAEGVSFRHAVELLRTGVAAERAAPIEPVERSTAQKLPDAVDLGAAGAELLDQVVGFYTETLLDSPDALDYLRSRGIGQRPLIDRFRLGYGNRTLGLRMPKRGTKDGDAIRDRLQAVGVLRKSGHEHFNGSVVVPVFGADGHVVEMYGRKVTPYLRKGTPEHLYLPGPHRGVWNVDALRSSKEVILCESLFDGLTFWAAGYRNVTSAYGIQGFTGEHLEAFQAYGTRRVLIAYDRDDAGEAAAKKLAPRLLEAGIECWRIEFPRGMDANEYALRVTPAPKSLGLAIRKASWMGSGQAPADGPTAEVAAEQSIAVPETLMPETLVPEISPASSEPSPEPAAPVPAAPEPAAPEPTPEPAPAESCPEAPPASPVPAAPARPVVPAEVDGEQVVIRLGDRRYRVRGLAKNHSYEVLKLNLLAGRDCAGRGEGYHVDTFDLYSARHRRAFVKLAAEEMGVEEGVVQGDLGRVLLKLEELQDAQIRAALVPEAEAPVEIPEGEREAALELLRDPRLLERVLEDFARCGVVGEETNKLMGYLATVSRKTDEPLAVIIRSSSAAGKSSLMEAILAFVPEEERVQYSAMTGQSLFYMGETDLAHKILAIVEEEGAERASYALKLLQSEGELTIASTGKDPESGRLVTQEYRVEGPVMILLTTTAIDIDEELLNRCLVLSVDEGREQTRAIHQLQRARRTLEGLKARARREVLTRLHQNAQRLLRPLAVMNPWAPRLTFLDVQTRTRRDHEKYLTLIDSIALLHQYQREEKSFEEEGRKVAYVEVELSDIEMANRLAHEVLGRTLDELPPQTRRLLVLLDRMVSAACEELEMDRVDFRFSRREVREATGWTYFQVRVHLDRLVELEYVLVHRGGRGQSFVYELLWAGGEEERPQMPGLIDVEALRDGRESRGTTKSLRGREPSLRGRSAEFEPPLSPHLAPIEGGLRGGETPGGATDSGDSEGEGPNKAYRGSKKTARRTVAGRRTPVAAREA